MRFQALPIFFSLWIYLLTSTFFTIARKTNNGKAPKYHYFCLSSFLVTYLEPSYLLSTEASCLYSPRLKLQRYTLTQFNITLQTSKMVEFPHFCLKLFKIFLYANSKYTHVAVIILLCQTNISIFSNSRDIKLEERLSEMGMQTLRNLEVVSYLVRFQSNII